MLTAGATGVSSFQNCEVWLEKPVEDGGTLTYAIRADTVIQTPTQNKNPSTSTDDAGFFETTVDVDGRSQRIRVYDPNNVLPAGTKLLASAVTEHSHLDKQGGTKHQRSYNISLV